MKDMTKKQFEEACKRHGFKKNLFLIGYWQIHDGTHCSVYAPNGGDTYRQKLAYLIKQHDRQEVKYAEYQQLKNSEH